MWIFLLFTLFPIISWSFLLSKRFITGEADWGTSIAEFYDEAIGPGYIAYAKTDIGSSARSVVIFRLNLTLDVVWMKKYDHDDSSLTCARDFFVFWNSTVLLTCNTENGGGLDRGFHFMVNTSDGSVMWDASYDIGGYFGEGSIPLQTGEGEGYWVIGNDNGDVIIGKFLALDGSSFFTKKFDLGPGTGNDNRGNTLLQHPNGDGIFLTGRSSAYDLDGDWLMPYFAYIHNNGTFYRGFGVDDYVTSHFERLKGILVSRNGEVLIGFAYHGYDASFTTRVIVANANNMTLRFVMDFSVLSATKTIISRGIEMDDGTFFLWGVWWTGSFPNFYPLFIRMSADLRSILVAKTSPQYWGIGNVIPLRYGEEGKNNFGLGVGHWGSGDIFVAKLDLSNITSLNVHCELEDVSVDYQPLSVQVTEMEASEVPWSLGTRKDPDITIVDLELEEADVCFTMCGHHSTDPGTLDDTEFCNGHGECSAWSDTCVCEGGYFLSPDENDCTVTTCYGVYSNSSESCGLHGECMGLNVCQCSSLGDYIGAKCDVVACYGFAHNDSLGACNGYGNCSAPNTCDCDDNFFGKECEVWGCGEYLSNDTQRVCQNGVGNCTFWGNCTCPEGKYWGPLCEEFTCGGVDRRDNSSVCSGHGVCVMWEVCDCAENYTAPDCTWTCFGKEVEDNKVCSGHGECVSLDTCVCDDLDNYQGTDCSFWSCYNVSVFDVDIVCGSHGLCIDEDLCMCFQGYETSTGVFGDSCDLWTCNEIQHMDASVCNERGECIEFNVCECQDEYEGEDCDTWSCAGYDWKFKQTCNGKGECEEPNKCNCNAGYGGMHCEENLLYYTVMTPILSVAAVFVLLLLFACCICVLCCGCICLCVFVFFMGVVLVLTTANRFQRVRMKRFSMLKNFDLLLKEQELDGDENIPHLRINQNLFAIPFKEIKIVRLLGEGGSNSIVYLAKWSGMNVAFKCFKTRMVMSSQDKFDEFEQEVGILGSLSHPNIIRFFGASLEVPRVGIVMEYASNGEILEYIQEFRKENDDGLSYPFLQKLRMSFQISSAMEYLHSRSVIHRDLKPENVLIDAEENTKLMDFGLSKFVERMSTAKTSRVGTDVYMAPEIVASEKYDEKCDIFSFAILMYVLITENPTPYGKGKYQVEMKVANDEKYRPSLKKLQEFLEKDEDGLKQSDTDWLVKMITKCWSHLPSERYSFREIRDILELKSEVNEKYSSIKKEEVGWSEKKHLVEKKRREFGEGVFAEYESLSKEDLKKEWGELFESLGVKNAVSKIVEMKMELESVAREEKEDGND